MRNERQTWRRPRSFRQIRPGRWAFYPIAPRYFDYFADSYCERSPWWTHTRSLTLIPWLGGER